MDCTIAIYNGDQFSQRRGRPYYEVQSFPCFTPNDTSVPSLLRSLFQDKLNIRSFDPIRDREFAFRSTLFSITNFGHNAETLGEHKIVLEKVDYVQCIIDENGRQVWRQMDPYPRVCEVNFTLTAPYIIQKTPAGNINASSIELGRYYDIISGEPLFYGNRGLLNNILSATESTYLATQEVRNAFDAFINRYSRLAVSAASSRI
jgi:hypothetical protein